MREQRRLARLDREPVAPRLGARKRGDAPAVWSRIPTDEPAQITTTSLAPTAARRASCSAPSSSGTIIGGDGSPPASRTSAPTDTLSASRTCPGTSAARVRRHDLVAGGEDRDARDGVDGDLDHPGRGEQRHVLRAQRTAPRGDCGSRGDVLVEPDDVLAGRHRADDLDRVRGRLGRVLDHHDRVGTRRQHPAGGDRDRGPGTDLIGGRGPIRTAPTTRRYPGIDSDAPYVSAARTA